MSAQHRGPVIKVTISQGHCKGCAFRMLMTGKVPPLQASPMESYYRDKCSLKKKKVKLLEFLISKYNKYS